MNIAKVDPRVSDLTPDAQHFLVHLTQTANQFFDEIACSMAPGERNDYFTIKTTKEMARRLVDKTAKAVYDVTRDFPNVHLVFFPAGAMPIAKRIQKIGYPASRMHALDISGSKGTKSGSSRINETIDPVLLEPGNHIVISEDIIDSVNALYTFIESRGINRDPGPDHVIKLHTLAERLKAAHDNGNNDPHAYAEFARVAAEENVSILSVWSKNEQAQKALVNQACCITPPENLIQKDLFFHYPITPLPSKLWVLGGDYVMDTGIVWPRIHKELPASLHNDPRISQYTDWLVRAVRIGPLAYFETEEQEANVIRFFAGRATEMLAS